MAHEKDAQEFLAMIPPSAVTVRKLHLVGVKSFECTDLSHCHTPVFEDVGQSSVSKFLRCVRKTSHLDAADVYNADRMIYRGGAFSVKRKEFAVNGHWSKHGSLNCQRGTKRLQILVDGDRFPTANLFGGALRRSP
jgi:hypothetical protein